MTLTTWILFYLLMFCPISTGCVHCHLSSRSI
jgi:hypothetical protein